MDLLGRIAAKRAGAAGRKAFSEPPFWALDGLRYPFLSVSARPDREQLTPPRASSAPATPAESPSPQ